MKTSYTSIAIATILLVASASSYSYTEAEAARPSSILNFIETSLEGNKCDCNTAADCGYNEHCKPSNCHENEGLSYGHCKPNEGPPPPPQCYNLGESCNKNSDCWEGGTNFCQVCGDEPGTDNHKTCYNPPPEPPTPSPQDVGQCGLPCNNNNDCKSEYVGTYNPCVVCSRYTGDVGTQWVCVDPSEAAEDRDEAAKYLRGN